LVEEFPGEVVLLLIGGRDPIHPTGLTEQEEGDLFKIKHIVNVGYTSEVEKYWLLQMCFCSKQEEGLLSLYRRTCDGVLVDLRWNRGNRM
jgi:hypothetical protein